MRPKGRYFNLMKTLIRYDPTTKMRVWAETDNHTNDIHIVTQQHDKEIVDYCKQLANNSSYKRHGIKNNRYHFATIPNGVVVELMHKYNLSVYNKHDLPKIEKVLKRDYKALLTVDKI